MPVLDLAGRWRRLAATGVLAALLALLVGTPTTGIVLHSITINGNVSDWADVLTDPENVVADAGSFSDPVDPDVPGTADRDLRGAAFTYDATNLYLFFRRTLSGNSAFEYLAYIDLGHDGRLNATDVVVRLSYNGAAFSGGSIRRYVPADAIDGDPVTGDGVDEPGTLGATLPGVPSSANSPDGIEFEAAVPWSALGVPWGTCLFIHPAISRGVNLPGQVEDNADPLDTQDVEPTLQLDQDGSTSSPGQVDYAHVACNDGSCTDTLDLTVRSGDNWRIQIWSDPDGDGDPADGVLLATDGNGDGDYSDDRDGDALAPGADSNGNELLDTGPLARDACFSYVVRVFVPAGTSAGTMDVESVRARSAARPRDLVRNTDRTNVGPITVFADETATAFPGDLAWLPHWTCNHQAFADTFLLSATSTRGWPVQVFRDPNGDGDPADAVAAPSIGPLAPGECAALFVRASVPGGEPAGVEDQIVLRATSAASASITETALDRVTVAAERFSLVPNHDRDAGPGNVLFLPHVITNHQGILDSFQLTATSADPAYTITLLTDPDGDGEPDDSATIAGGSIVGPVERNGGELRFLLRVDVPSGAVIGSSNTVTVTIRSQADTTRTDVATDIIRIRRILTYSDPLFARPSKTFFTGCSLVYVQAHGLQVNREYRFLWIDPAAVTQRTSPAYNPDARGRADDAFALPCGPVPGGWSVRLQIRNGSAWNDVADAVASFTTLDPAADGGEVTRLEADQPVYDRDGDAVSVEATFENDTDADYLDTFADYVLFQDLDGNGQPTAGEPYILADGSRSTWDPGEQTHRTEPIGILSGDSYEDYWRVDAAQFDLEGTWCVHVRWVQRCNSGSCSEIAIDTALTCFLVSCLPAPVVDAGAPKQACEGDPVALSDAASDGNTHSWSDGGAGGTFSPSSTVLQPQWTAPGPGSYTLTLASTFTATGCTTQDTVAVTIHPEPSADAGPGATTCAGETVATGGSASGDVHAWDDGGAGGTFTPSAASASPSYTPPDPSPASITLTLTTTVSATGCSATDTATIVVDPNPAVDAGADAVTCAGDAVALGDATSSGDTHAWSDGGAGGSFVPSAAVLNPSYVPPDPSPASVTLTLQSTVSATGCSSSDTRIVTVNANPVASAGADLATCAGEGVAMAATSDGDAHSWSDGGAGGSFTPSASVLSPTYVPADPAPAAVTLTLTSVHSATGCDTVDSLTLTVDPNPVVSAGSDATTCAGSGVALSSATSDGDAHAWSDGGAGGTFTPSASVLNPTYVPSDPSPALVTLTLLSSFPATGCETSDSLALTVHPNPVVDAGPDATACAGETITLSPASDGATHAWDDGGAGGTFSPSASVLAPAYTAPDPAPASITLTLTSTSVEGCATSDTSTIDVEPQATADAGADSATCAGQGVPLSDATATGDAVSWSDGGAGGTFSPSPAVLAATYVPADPSPSTVTLTLTSTIAGSSCDASDSRILTVHPRPAVSAGADRATCAGTPVPMSDADGGIADTFSWSDGGAGGTFAPSASVENPSYSNATPGARTLTLTATVAATGCSRQDTVIVTVNAHPAVEAGAPKEGCAGSPIALADATSDAATVSWSDGGAGGSFSPSSSVLNPSYTRAATGVVTLTLTATSAEGCVTTDTVAVTIRPVPVADFAAPATACEDAPVCFDDLSTDATAWSWSFGDPSGGTSTEREPCYTYSTPGTYDVTLTASNACGAPSRTRTVVIGAKPVADFSYSTQGNRFCRAKDVTFTDLSSGSPASWEWDFGDGTTSTAQNPVHQYATDGVFIVRLVACNGCGCGAPRYRAVEIAATCNANCEANSNQIECADAPATITGDTCADHDNFNTTSYACAPGLIYGGDNKSYDLDFLAGSNFVIRIIETTPEPNGYDLDLIVSDQCNPPRCVAWGDTEVRYDDRTTANDDFFLVVDGRDGTCGPYTLEVECLDPADTAACTPPDFAGIVSATDENTCLISGILVAWDPAASWGLGPAGPCAGGTYEIWRAPASDPSDERRVGTATPPATSFLDVTAVPGTEYVYRVHAINDFCGEPALTTASANATDLFGDQPVLADAGPDRRLTCDAPTATLSGSADGGTGSGYTWSWSPAAGLSDPSVPNPVVSSPGTYVLTVTDVGNGCQDTDSVSVTSAPAPVAAAGPDLVIDCVTTTVTLQGGATGGDASGGRTFAWSPAGPLSDATIATPSTSTAGTYVLTVTDLATGCVSTDSATVTRNDAIPTASAGPDAVLTCAGPVTLAGSASGGDGSGGYLYAWSPAAGLDDPASPTPITSVGGTWSLVVTDAVNGCVSAPDEVTVTENLAEPVAGAGPDHVLSCSVPEVTLDGSASGGDGSAGYAFAWSPPENVSDPTVEDPTTSVPGTYVLTVTDLANACTSTDEVTLSTDPNAPVANAGPDRDITCAVGVVQLEGSASGGDDSLGYEYRWEPASDVSDPDIPNPTTLVPGTYTLQVTTPADGCRVQDVVVVNDETQPPVASAGPDGLLTCVVLGVTLQGSATGNDGRLDFDYAWDPPGGLSDPAAQQPVASQEGTWTLTVTDRYTGCSSQDTVTVSRDVTPPDASAGADKVITCASPTVTLDGDPGAPGTYAFAWAPAAGLSDPAAQAPTTTTAGTWTLTVTNLANGCTDADEVTVTGTSVPPVASAGPDRVLDCRVLEATLDGAASGGDGSLGYDFAWEPSSDVSDPIAEDPTTTLPGTYTVTVTDRLTGCAATDTVTVALDRAPPIVDAGPGDSVTCVRVAQLSGTATGGNGSLGYDYSWTPVAGLSTPTERTTLATEGGTYTFRATSRANGCFATDTVVVEDLRIAPTVTAGPDKVLDCDTASVVLEGNATGGDDSRGYVYFWSPSAGLSSNSVARPTATLPGTYTLWAGSAESGCAAEDTVVVTLDDVPPIADAGPDQVITCAMPEVPLVGNASGGNGSLGWDFSWSFEGREVRDPFVDRPGTYTLTVVDRANGCTDTDTLEVTVDQREPVADAGPDQVIPCSTGVVRLLGSAGGGNGTLGYAYSWTPAGPLDDPSLAQPMASAPGVYTLRVRDVANGCEDTATVRVTRGQPPDVNPGPDGILDCDTPAATLTANVTGAPAPRTYDWSPSAGVANPSALTTTTTLPGDYTLTVTEVATGCATSVVVRVTEDRRAPVADAGPDRVMACDGSGGTLVGGASGGNGSLGYAVAWTPPALVSNAGSLTTQALGPGTFTLTITDLANGCTASDDVVVTQPVLPPVADARPGSALTCTAPAALTGSASGGDGSLGYDAAWTPTLGVADPASLVTTTTEPGTYTLTVTDRATGCRATDTVIIGDGPRPPVADAGSDLSASCAQPATLLGAASGGSGGAYSYAWSPPGDLSDPNVAQPVTTVPGVYTLTVTDLVTGCSASDDVTVLPAFVAIPPDPSAVDLRPGATPLLVRPVDRAFAQIEITWEDVGAFTDHLYQGTIAAVGPPAGGAYDHVPAACGLAASSAVLATPAGNVYFLAVAANCEGGESSYGRTSRGQERPAGVPACP